MAGSCARLLNYYFNSIELTQLVLVVASDSESIGPGLARKVLRLHSGRPSERPKCIDSDLIHSAAAATGGGGEAAGSVAAATEAAATAEEATEAWRRRR
eukprot:scaffold24734_cov61-Phaeocystis_antarctica.AAC.7